MTRPLHAAGDLRDKFDTYLNSAERSIVSERAKAAGLPMSAFIRRAVLRLRCTPIPAINAEQWVKLSRMSANLNQIAKSLNEGDQFSINAMTTISDMRGQLAEIRLSLTGKSR